MLIANLKPQRTLFTVFTIGTIFVVYWNRQNVYQCIDNFILSLSCMKSEKDKVELLFRLSDAADLVINSVKELEKKLFNECSSDLSKFKSVYRKEILVVSEDLSFVLIKLDQINGRSALNRWRKKIVHKLQQNATSKVDAFVNDITKLMA